MSISYTDMVAGKHYIEVTCTLSTGQSDIVYFILTLTQCGDAKITSFSVERMDYLVYSKTLTQNLSKAMIEKNAFCQNFISYELMMIDETEEVPDFITLTDLQLSV